MLLLMVKYLISFVLFMFLLVDSHAAGLSTFFVDSNNFFRSWIRQGKVNYAGVKKNFEPIRDLYEQVNRMDLSKASDLEKKAFYINAYNLIVIHQIAMYYPLKSPMNQSGFFDKVKHPVAGESMTLNYLEIKKIVLPYRDPRIHFSLACAARSCPPLASFAYLPGTLDQQLDERTRKSLNDPTFVRVKRETAEVSKIFDWYQSDFTQDGQTVLAFINQYRIQKIPESCRVVYYEYDWQLNDI